MADSVLLIDHDADELRAVGDYFDGIGYAVERAGAAEAGLEAFDRVRPDVVILDRQLPDLDGLDVLERLRSREGAVILLTDQGDIATGARAMQLGAEHVVAKPVDLNHLAAVTARVCDKVRLMRQNALLREALEQLLSTPRPGKAREIWKAVEHLPADLRRGGGGGDGGGGGGGGRRHQPQALAEVERVHIEKTLRFHGGNRTRAAKELGISRATLINKIKAYGL
ncbi:MAG TPA: response regulator, partial [Gemmatimonadales bacterium]|nr:response regulator [Gemmatimonadales bacterium]